MTAPRIPGDSTLAFASDGYRFGIRRFDRLRTDVFDTRLMLRPVTFLRGSEAARFFYEGGRFSRAGALPRSVLHLLQDEGSVQTLSDAEHEHRKAVFLSLTAPRELPKLTTAFRAHFLDAVSRWSVCERVVLHEGLAEVLTRSVCDWSGVPLPEERVAGLTEELFAMIEKAGTVGPPNWLARLQRRRTERWTAELITGVRNGTVTTRPGSALVTLAGLTDTEGRPLDPAVCAVELINVLRPTVAVGRFIVYCAWALQQHPAWQARFAAGDDTDLDGFVQEVRRFFPFFPAVGGTAAGDCSFDGKQLKAGAWVMLDLYATNHHEKVWPRPEEFLPQRFRRRTAGRNELVPQGGGYATQGHRCPGEDPTIELMREAVRLLTRAVRYDVPEQDLRISLRRIPAAPQNGFIISNVRAVPAGVLPPLG